MIWWWGGKFVLFFWGWLVGWLVVYGQKRRRWASASAHMHRQVNHTNQTKQNA